MSGPCAICDTLLTGRQQKFCSQPCHATARRMDADRRLPERFAERWQENDDGCWLWQLPLMPKGYGAFSYKGEGMTAHRAAWLLHKGAIPAGMVLDHYRLNKGPRQAPCSRRCVNPEHLELTTHRTNILRGVSNSAVHARKTHCPRGHAYDENTRLYRGMRYCKQCLQMRNWRRKLI